MLQFTDLINMDLDTKIDILVELQDQLVIQGKSADILPYSLYTRDARLKHILLLLFEYSQVLGIDISLVKTKRKIRTYDIYLKKMVSSLPKNLQWLSIQDIVKNIDSMDINEIEAHNLKISNPELLNENVGFDINYMLDSFVEWFNINGFSFQDAKKLLYKILLSYIGIFRNEDLIRLKTEDCNIELDRDLFGTDWRFPLAHILLVFQKLQYIKVKNSPYLGTSYSVHILPIFLEILLAHKNLEDIILDSFIDKKYKEVRIFEQKSSIHIERHIDIVWDETRFVDLQKQYPHSDIKAKNYNGKTTKYEVKERIKLNNIEQE